MSVSPLSPVPQVLRCEGSGGHRAELGVPKHHRKGELYMVVIMASLAVSLRMATYRTNLYTQCTCVNIAVCLSVCLSLQPIIAYDFEQMDAVLTEVGKLPGLKPLGVKLAPYFDMCHFERAAAVVAKHSYIKFVVTTNTIGNALFVDADNECAAIAPKGGLGGLGGGYVKQTALANVHMLYKLLREKGRADIDVVGVGGVRSGKDVFEMILCGASAVQVRPHAVSHNHSPPSP